MKSKRCCYVDRECTKDCVAFFKTPKMPEDLREAGVPQIECLRLLAEVGSLGEDEDWDEEE